MLQILHLQPFMWTTCIICNSLFYVAGKSLGNGKRLMIANEFTIARIPQAYKFSCCGTSLHTLNFHSSTLIATVKHIHNIFKTHGKMFKNQKCFLTIELSSFRVCLTTRKARLYMLWRQFKMLHMKAHRSLPQKSGHSF